MIVYTWIVLVLEVVSVLASPYMIGTTRDRNFPLSQMTTFAALVPIFGRVLGWW